MNQRVATAKFLSGQASAAEKAKNFNLTIPHVDLNKALSDAISRERVAKLVKSLPIETITLDLHSTWEDDVNHHMQALMHGPTLKGLTFINAGEELDFIPAGIRAWDVHTRQKKEVLGYIASTERLPTVKRTGGSIPSAFWTAVQNRDNPINYLELNRVDFWMDRPEETSEAMSKVTNIKIKEVTMMGKPMNRELAMKIFNRQMPNDLLDDNNDSDDWHLDLSN